MRWDLTGRPPFRSEVLSHPSVNVSVEQGSHPRFGHELPAVLLHGVVTRRFTVDLIGAGRVTAVKFRPGGFAALTGVLPGRDTVSPARVRARDLGRRACCPPSWPRTTTSRGPPSSTRRWRPRHRSRPDPYLDLLGLVAAMIEDRELVRVDQVAALGAMSVRSLQRLFATYVGVSPKAVLARYRLQDAAAAIDAGEVDDLAGLAASLGWFDQAHFSRDFRSVVGLTPSAYLQRARG